jgi:beta-aspartyl-peptidase (threonine type)
MNNHANLNRCNAMPESSMSRKYLPSLLLILFAFTAPVSTLAETESPIAIAIHAGAGTMNREDMDQQLEAQIRGALLDAVQAGHHVLRLGGSSLDAVQAAVTRLEDSPHFNAGRGAVFNADGKNEMDASIMDGSNLQAGAVAGIHNIKNPILLARRVMTDSPHVMLMGEGAEMFAREQELEFADDDYFYTERRWEQLQKAKQKGSDKSASNGGQYPDRWMSTVGAVALDSAGNLAAATSTGGMTNKSFGRVGDSPIIGAGTYADNRSCAVSATGHGEYFIRATVARDICARMQFQGVSLQKAADDVVMGELVQLGGTGGIISVDKKGNIALVFNTEGMYRASVDTGGNIQVAIYKDDDAGE